MHTVYAKTKEECKALLEKMIAEVRERINEEKRQMKETGTAKKQVIKQFEVSHSF